MSERSVEQLCDELRAAATGSGNVDLWVPDRLTLNGEPVPDQPSGIAMTIIVNTALSVGLWPDGFTEGAGGRTYHYRTK